ncbi:MAG: VanW family protein [bacterium]|nr:VanW family protein [bacterium]
MKKKSFYKFIQRMPRWKIIVLVCFFVGLPIVALGLPFLFYSNRIMPGVHVGSIELSGKTRPEAVSLLRSQLKSREDATITFIPSNGAPEVTVGKVRDYASYDVDKTVELAFEEGRKGGLDSRLRAIGRILREGVHISPIYAYDKNRFDERLANAIRPLERPVINSQLALVKDTVILTSSQSGYVAHRDHALADFESYLALRSNKPQFSIPLADKKPDISVENSQDALRKAQSALARPLTLKSTYLPASTWSLTKEQLFALMDLRKADKAVDVVVTDYKVASYTAEIAGLLNREPIEAKFQLEGERVSTFEPAQPGLELNSEELTKEIASRAFDPAKGTDIEIPVRTKEPAITTEAVNNYGIKELVGQGTSKFRGSPAGRIHNLSLASNKLNGVLIAPGETFSMYKVVGEVEKSTGYQDAFVILNGRTVPGVGGGLCQVSTTLFRAVLNAGLPIKERHQHAYRVSYYEQNSQPGIDAAVYFPTWDFKFQNDTGNHLLLQTKVDTKASTAEFNLYGVKDGRTVEISKPLVTNQTPPPPELRIDDPNLKRGTENEVDHAVWGANVVFTRKVMKDGQQIIADTFKSNYKAWQRVVMVGVKDN